MMNPINILRTNRLFPFEPFHLLWWWRWGGLVGFDRGEFNRLTGRTMGTIRCGGEGRGASGSDHNAYNNPTCHNRTVRPRLQLVKWPRMGQLVRWPRMGQLETICKARIPLMEVFLLDSSKVTRPQLLWISHQVACTSVSVHFIWFIFIPSF